MSFEVEVDDDTIETVVNDPHDALGIPKDIEGAAVIVDDIFAAWPTTDVIDPSNGVVWSPDDKEELECGGHPAGPYDEPMGQTVYCDGSCKVKPTEFTE
jgi:hypothetical protein